MGVDNTFGKTNFNPDDARPPIKVNHGDVWGHGEDWFTFHCPNLECSETLLGEKECPRCGQKVTWKK